MWPGERLSCFANHWKGWREEMADLTSDYSFVRSLSFSVFVVCVIFMQHNWGTCSVGVERVSHHHFSRQSQTPATIYPLQKGLANQSHYGQCNLWCWKLSRQTDKPVASLTTAMSVGEPRPERSKTHDTILLYRPTKKKPSDSIKIMLLDISVTQQMQGFANW